MDRMTVWQANAAWVDDVIQAFGYLVGVDSPEWRAFLERNDAAFESYYSTGSIALLVPIFEELANA